MFFICKKPNCDALGSPRKMTNESGTVVWTGAYQPFGEMLAGTGNVHGFTGKELDAETGLNYFCQRYYDSQIGRFMTLDTWTHLPDDVRLFSHSKYLSWDNYRIKYEPRATKINMKEILNRKTRLFSYDTLTKELTSLFPVNVVFDDSEIFSMQVKNKSSVLRYYKITEKYQNQLNGYRYCWNNPVRYVDPTGNGFDERDWYITIFSTYFGTVTAILIPGSAGIASGAIVTISTAPILAWYWDYCMALDWYFSNFCASIPDFGYYNNQ